LAVMARVPADCPVAADPDLIGLGKQGSLLLGPKHECCQLTLRQPVGNPLTGKKIIQ
jgi:hypothetical protein